VASLRIGTFGVLGVCRHLEHVNHRFHYTESDRPF
jgi:hypothetical protein